MAPNGLSPACSGKLCKTECAVNHHSGPSKILPVPGSILPPYVASTAAALYLVDFLHALGHEPILLSRLVQRVSTAR